MASPPFVERKGVRGMAFLPPSWNVRGLGGWPLAPLRLRKGARGMLDFAAT